MILIDMVFLYVYISDQEIAHSRPITRVELYRATHMNKDNVPIGGVVKYSKFFTNMIQDMSTNC
jgi:hypothetical protein